MAKIEIKKNVGAKGIQLSDYQVLIDGHEPSMITGLDISMGVGEYNSVQLNFKADEIILDGNFKALLAMKADEQERRAKNE